MQNETLVGDKVEDGAPVILAVAGGFYFFGFEVASPRPNYVCLRDASMFCDFSSPGLPLVAKGAKEARVELDRFELGRHAFFPEIGVYAIMPSIDLYTWENTKIR